MEPPYHEMSPMRVLLKIQKSEPPTLEKPSRWSPEFNDFLRRTLVKDPQQRSRAEELLNVRHNRTFALLKRLPNHHKFELQHQFVVEATDPKSILDLLAEYKAEIVEEEIEDLQEDKEVGFHFVVFSVKEQKHLTFCTSHTVLQWIYLMFAMFINSCTHKRSDTDSRLERRL
jgi:serine/threonine protein kinase